MTFDTHNFRPTKLPLNKRNILLHSFSTNKVERLPSNFGWVSGLKSIFSFLFFSLFSFLSSFPLVKSTRKRRTCKLVIANCFFYLFTLIMLYNSKSINFKSIDFKRSGKLKTFFRVSLRNKWKKRQSWLSSVFYFISFVSFFSKKSMKKEKKKTFNCDSLKAVQLDN